MTTVVLAAVLAGAPCDLGAPDSAPGDGYCVSEDDFAALGELRAERAALQATVAAQAAELEAFSAWRDRTSALHLAHVDALQAAHEQSIALVVAAAHADDGAARRTWFERHGFAVGVGVGVVAGVVVAGLVLDAYGEVLAP